MANRFLTFDFGAESGRAILATLDGQRMHLEELHRFPTHNGHLQGRFQWDLVGLWNEIKKGLRAASHKGSIDSIGVDTWGVDFGLLDSAGRVINNPTHYRDARTEGMVEKVFSVFPREKVFNSTGIQFMQINTLYHLYSLVVNNAWELSVAKRMLFMPDLFHYLLSGVAANELSIASTSQMLNPRTRTWSDELFSALKLPRHLLADPVAPGTKIGGITFDVAAETGLLDGTPVVAPASHDTASAVVAVPYTGPANAGAGGGWCYLSSGTWSLMGVETPTPVVDDRTLRMNFTNELGAAGQVRLLKNIMGLWLVQETRRDLARRGPDYEYAELTRLAAEAGGVADNAPHAPVLDSWHPPFGSPGDFISKIQSHAKSTCQPIPETPGQLVRACLDSLALSYRLVADRLETLTGKPITTIHIVGGGTKNLLLNQLTADATGRTVITGPVEATALGNALSQAMGLGIVKDLHHARQISASSFELQTYHPKNTANWTPAYEKFKSLVKE
jgi:rhamnulokinase